MPRRRECSFRDALTSLIAPRRIRFLAELLGAVKRVRKIDVVALVYSLVLGFAAGNRRTLASLRRGYERATETTLGPIVVLQATDRTVGEAAATARGGGDGSVGEAQAALGTTLS